MSIALTAIAAQAAASTGAQAIFTDIARKVFVKLAMQELKDTKQWADHVLKGTPMPNKPKEGPIDRARRYTAVALDETMKHPIIKSGMESILGPLGVTAAAGSFVKKGEEDPFKQQKRDETSKDESLQSRKEAVPLKKEALADAKISRNHFAR